MPPFVLSQSTREEILYIINTKFAGMPLLVMMMHDGAPIVETHAVLEKASDQPHGVDLTFSKVTDTSNVIPIPMTWNIKPEGLIGEKILVITWEVDGDSFALFLTKTEQLPT